MDIQLMVRFDERLDAAVIGSARGQLEAAGGVFAAEPCRGQAHLMMIRYDPGTASAGRIVAALRDMGFQARAVGR